MEEKILPKLEDAGGPMGLAAKFAGDGNPVGPLLSKLTGFGNDDDEEGGGSGAGDGTGKGRRMPIQQAVDVAAPIDVVYDQFTQFEEWPKFMHRVESVNQKEDETVSFSEKMWLFRRQWDAEIIEQRPDERIVWESTSGMKHTGVVTFHELAERLTRVEVNVDINPSGPIEKIARGARFAKRAVRADLKRFKAYMEMHEDETGSWRGEIEDGEVVTTPEEYEEQEREEAEAEAEDRARGRVRGAGGRVRGRGARGRVAEEEDEPEAEYEEEEPEPVAEEEDEPEAEYEEESPRPRKRTSLRPRTRRKRKRRRSGRKPRRRTRATQLERLLEVARAPHRSGAAAPRHGASPRRRRAGAAAARTVPRSRRRRAPRREAAQGRARVRARARAPAAAVAARRARRRAARARRARHRGARARRARRRGAGARRAAGVARPRAARRAGRVARRPRARADLETTEGAAAICRCGGGDDEHCTGNPRSGAATTYSAPRTRAGSRRSST